MSSIKAKPKMLKQWAKGVCQYCRKSIPMREHVCHKCAATQVEPRKDATPEQMEAVKQRNAVMLGRRMQFVAFTHMLHGNKRKGQDILARLHAMAPAPALADTQEIPAAKPVDAPKEYAREQGAIALDAPPVEEPTVLVLDVVKEESAAEVNTQDRDRWRTAPYSELEEAVGARFATLLDMHRHLAINEVKGIGPATKAKLANRGLL